MNTEIVLKKSILIISATLLLLLQTLILYTSNCNSEINNDIAKIQTDNKKLQAKFQIQSNNLFSDFTPNDSEQSNKNIALNLATLNNQYQLITINIEKLSKAIEEISINQLSSTNSVIQTQQKTTMTIEEPIYSHEQNDFAMEQATSIIKDAIENQKWTNTDNIAMMENSRYLSSQQRREIQSKLFTAINSQKIDLDAMLIF